MEEKIENIVNAIIADIKSRSGLDGIWYDMDDEIKNEIKNTWQNIIKTKLE